MSYILDALRRSQAERERGRVPGLDAQLAPAEPPVPQQRGRNAIFWAGCAVALALLVALAALLWRRDAPPVTADSAPPVASAARPPPAPEPRPYPSPPALPIVVSAPPLPAVAGASAAGGAEPRAAAAPGASRALPLAELSAEQRRDLPVLAIGGSVWSENAASRFIIVGGQIVHEGEAAAPGVVVERIGPKSVVVRWRELRLELPL